MRCSLRGKGLLMTTSGSWSAVGLASASGNTLVWGSLGLSILLAAGRWCSMPKPRPQMSSHLGEVNWSFSNSWASSLTAGGAFLGTILAASVVPANAVPFRPGAYRLLCRGNDQVHDRLRTAADHSRTQSGCLRSGNRGPNFSFPPSSSVEPPVSRLHNERSAQRRRFGRKLPGPRG
jgi:hypothetical protein